MRKLSLNIFTFLLEIRQIKNQNNVLFICSRLYAILSGDQITVHSGVIPNASLGTIWDAENRTTIVQLQGKHHFFSSWLNKIHLEILDSKKFSQIC